MQCVSSAVLPILGYFSDLCIVADGKGTTSVVPFEAERFGGFGR
jgi:hypothetical protein